MNETLSIRHPEPDYRTEEESFFFQRKPSLDDSLDEQTIRQILFDKRRELDMIPSMPEHLQNDSPLNMLLTIHFGDGTPKIIEDCWIERYRAPIVKCVKKLEYILRSRNDKKSWWGRKEVDLDEKKNSIPIREFIWSFITLPNRSRPGSLIPCPLPKHNDKTGSFMIYDKSNRWQCFGSCACGWTHIDFIMHLEGCSVAEAVKKFINY